MDELYVVCENYVLCVASVLCSYNITYALCVVVHFMMQKLASMSVTIQLSTNEDDELPEKVLLGSVTTKGRCSTAHTYT